jgi:hypothetical protein
MRNLATGCPAEVNRGPGLSTKWPTVAGHVRAAVMRQAGLSG